MTELHPGVELDGDTVRITNPHAVRLLAHPERQRLVWALYDGDTFTATAAAQRFGLTPSAMSYHLRQLEKWGLVTRHESDDGRERPWAARAKNISVSPEAVGSAGRESAMTYYGTYGTLVQETLASASQDPGGAHLWQTRLELTPEEMRSLSRELSALVDRYERRAEDEPCEDRRTHDVILGVVARPDR